LDAYFFIAYPDHISKTAVVHVTPKVGVVKDNDLIFHDPNECSMERFIQLEKFLTFVELTCRLQNLDNIIYMK
jgi:hypothetical protein